MPDLLDNTPAFQDYPSLLLDTTLYIGLIQH
jgi:hypothetical protein